MIASLVATGVGLAFLRAENHSLGAGLALSGLLGFLLLRRWQEQHPLSEPEAQLMQKHALTILVWVGSFTLLATALVSLGTSQFRPAAENRFNVGLWAASIALPLGLAAWRSIHPVELRASIKTWLQAHWQKTLAAALIVLLGFVLRTYDLAYHPYPWSGDEISVGIEARRILQGEVTDFFATGWSGQPNWSFVPNALAFLAFGESISSIRLIGAVFGSLSILTTCLLAREMFGGRVGLLAAGFLAGFPFHLHFSRLGVHNIVDSLTVTLALWLVLRAARKGTQLAYLLAGIASGLAIYTYVGSRLVIALAFGVGLVLLFKERTFLRDNWRQVLAYAGILTLTIGPMAFYFATHPDQFMTRIGQESILNNNWLANEAARLGTSIWQVLLNQVARSTLVYISQPSIGNFFNSQQPYLTVLGAVPGLLGMALSLANIRNTGHATLQMWFWSVVTLGGILTLNPPANTRLVMTTPAVAIFIALGLEIIIGAFEKLRLLTGAWSKWLLAGVLLGVLLLQNSLFYFVEYRTNYYFHDASAELAMEAGQVLQDLQGREPHALYMLGAPRVFSGFPTIPFLVPQALRVDIAVQGDGTIIPGLAYNQAAFFVAIPENLGQLEQIRARYPGGQWLAVERFAKQEILFYGYILNSQQMKGFAPQE